MHKRKIVILVNYLKCSENRLLIFSEIALNPDIPTKIAEKLKLDRATVSRTIKQLEENELVTNYLPQIRKGKTFLLTQIGEEVFKDLERKSII
ncbi:MAG: MarR family transcriptional regulator [Candidatus Hodarchaeales archaeon]